MHKNTAKTKNPGLKTVQYHGSPCTPIDQPRGDEPDTLYHQSLQRDEPENGRALRNGGITVSTRYYTVE